MNTMKDYENKLIMKDDQIKLLIAKQKETRRNA